MAFFKLRIADKNIAVTAIYDRTMDFCRDYIADFEKEDFSVVMEESDIIAEMDKTLRERELEGLPPIRPSYPYLETLALYRKISTKMADYDTILFHGSAIAVDGVTYLFTAKSGTGKSTHTRLWREYFGDRAVMVNDDKPLIRVTDDSVTVYGTPWNGKHMLGENISVPLGAICILERAEENSIVEVDPISVFARILSQTYRPPNPDAMCKILAVVDKMLKRIPVYRLGCNMDPDAVLVSYNGMKGKST